MSFQGRIQEFLKGGVVHYWRSLHHQWTRRHMWVEFVVGSLLCSERFLSGYSVFSLSSKTNISKFQFDLYVRHLSHEPLVRVIAQALPVFDVKLHLHYIILHLHYITLQSEWRPRSSDAISKGGPEPCPPPTHPNKMFSIVPSKTPFPAFLRLEERCEGML